VSQTVKRGADGLPLRIEYSCFERNQHAGFHVSRKVLSRETKTIDSEARAL
jgi:hypothetical protein